MSAERHTWCTRCQEPANDAGIPECVCGRLWPALAAAPEQLALAIDVPRVERAQPEHDVGTLITLCRRLLEHRDEPIEDLPHLYRGRPVLTVITGGGGLL